MSKLLRIIVLAIMLFAQLLAGVNMGVSAETTIQDSAHPNLQTLHTITEQVAQPTIKIVGLPLDDVIETKVELNEGATALSLLKATATVVTEDSAWGPMIKAINGLEAVDPYYWAFYVNDGYGQVGAAEYKPTTSDSITFSYESWENVENEAMIEIVGDKTTMMKQPITEGATALSLLQNVAEVETEDSAWGPMITGINGKHAAGTFYWAFYVNGGMAPTGAGNYIPNAGDILTFTYESWEVPSEPPVGEESPEDPSEETPVGDLIEQTDKTAQWIKTKGLTSTWEAVAFRHLGKAIPISYFQTIETRINENDGLFTNVTDYETSVLALVLADKDPVHFNGYNLIEKIYNNERMTSQGLNGIVYGLLALDSQNFTIPENAVWTREKLIDYILHSQHSDGGWSLTGSISDVDMTAMTLTALAPYQAQNDVKAAIENAITWLSSKQLTNGGFSGKYGVNAETAATVLIALTALEIDPLENLTKEDHNLIEFVASYILEDGSFEHEKEDGTSNNYATEQGLLALVSYMKFLEGTGSIYDLTDVPPLVSETGSDQGGTTPIPGEVKKQTISISVRTHNSTLLSSKTIEVSEGATAFSALIDALGTSRVTSSGSGSSEYVIAIDGLAEFDHGPTSGWKYSVNGYFPSSGAGTYRLSDGDQLEWVYVLKDEEAEKEKAEMAAAAVNEKPANMSKAVFEAFKTIQSQSDIQNAIVNKEQRMSSTDAQKLRETLQANVVSIEKTVLPTEETVLSQSTVTEAEILIPKNAVTEQKKIKIEELDGPLEEFVKSTIYQFSPSGTKFEKPVYISITIPIESENVDHLVMAWLDEKKNEWVEIPTIIDAKTGVITGKVDHFTKFAVIDKNNTKGKKLDVKKDIENVIQYLKKDETQSEWEDFGLARMDEIDKEAVLATTIQKLREANGTFRKITDYERYALTIEAIGGDPTNIGGYNLIEKIYNNERMTLQGTNGLIFALLALDSANYEVPTSAKWNRKQLVAEILANQNKDGGFTLVTGEASDVDITAMAISALADYKKEANVQAAIDQAVTWLSDVQQASGGFIADGQENSESAAQVIIALASAGIDLNGDLFTKANGNVVSNLLSYQNEDGGFANLKNEESNQMASEQALMALIALDRYANNKASIYKFTNIEDATNVSSLIPSFKDINDVSVYALQSVYETFAKGIMNGVQTEPLRFAPKQQLTRAQFTTILVKLLEGEEAELDHQVVFEDVKQDHWYFNAVMKAHQLGIIRGTSETTFSPNAPITREQLALLLARAYHLKPKQDVGNNGKYSDITHLSSETQTAIAALSDYDLMQGYSDNLFKPNEFVTREMGAVIAIRIVENLNK